MNKEKEARYRSEFHEALDSLGINSGDILYIGSDIAGIVVSAGKELEFDGRTDRDAFLNLLIDELQNHVGRGGTLLFPVYSWKFCRGEIFDYKKTQGEVGAFNNYVLNNREDFTRTKHPLYSLMVWGKDAKMLSAIDCQEAWGEGSVFAYLHKNNAIELDLNVDALRSMTFKHYVEQSVKVPYRYPKYFLGQYKDENGVTETRAYSMYVRDLSVELKSTQTTEFFNRSGVGRSVTFHGLPINAIELGKAYDVIKDALLHKNGENIYSFTNYKIDWEDSAAANRYEIGFLKDKHLAVLPEGLS